MYNIVQEFSPFDVCAHSGFVRTTRLLCKLFFACTQVVLHIQLDCCIQAGLRLFAESSCLMRQCCGPRRGFDMKIVDNYGRVNPFNATFI